MNIPISDPETLARLATLSAAIDTAAEAVGTAQGAVAGSTERTDQLRATLDAHRAVEPSLAPDMADELSSLLAANPGAAKSADWTGRLREAQAQAAAAHQVWSGELTILEQALAKVDGENAVAREAFASARAEYDKAFRDFVCEARDAVMSEFEERFAEFFALVLRPLECFKLAREPYSGKPMPDHLTPHGPRLSGDTRVVLRRLNVNPPAFAAATTDIVLYPRRDDPDWRDGVAEFRNGLAAAAAGRSAKASPARK